MIEAPNFSDWANRIDEEYRKQEAAQKKIPLEEFRTICWSYIKNQLEGGVKPENIAIGEYVGETKDPEIPYVEQYNIKSLKTILKEGIPEIKWRVENIIPERATVIFGGTSGALKTWTAMSLALSCASGEDFLGNFKTNKCKVLYIDEENGDITLPNRFNKLKKGHELTCSFDNLYISIFNGIKLDEELGAKTIKGLIEELKPNVVIVDSMVRCMLGEEDKATDVRKIFDNLKPILTQYQDIAFVILHHTIKGNRQTMHTLRGSGDFAAFADVILMFNNHKVFTNVETVKNRHIAKEDMPVFSLKLEGTENSGLKLQYYEANPEEQNAIQDCVDEIKAWYDNEKMPYFRSKQVIEELTKVGHKKNTIYSALNELKDSKEISKQKRGLWKVENPVFTTEKLVV